MAGKYDIILCILILFLERSQVEVGIYLCITFQAYVIEIVKYFAIDASEVSCSMDLMLLTLGGEVHVEA